MGIRFFIFFNFCQTGIEKIERKSFNFLVETGNKDNKVKITVRTVVITNLLKN